MQPFLSLPNEIWTLVVSHLDIKKDQRTIRALRTTSKQLYEIADPLVYVTVGDGPPGYEWNRPIDRVLKVMGVSRHLAQHAEFARHIKEFALWQWDGNYQYLAVKPEYEKFMLDSNGARAAIQTSNMSSDLKKVLLANSTIKDLDTHLSFILSMCTNLEVLTIGQSFANLPALMRHIMSNVFATPSEPTTEPLRTPLQSLTRLTIGAKRSCQLCDLQDFLPLLALPSLEYLSVSDLEDHRSTRHGIHHLPELDASSLSRSKASRTPVTIVLDMCILSAPALAYTMKACSFNGKSLESFMVRWRPGLWNENLINTDIGDAIRDFAQFFRSETARDIGLKCNLKTLLLDSTEDFRIEPRNTPRPSFGSLSELEALERLGVPMAAVRDYNTMSLLEILPANLQQLYVLGLNELEKEFQEQADATMPNLQTVNIPWHHYSVEEWFGDVPHQCVNYNSFPELDCELRNMQDPFTWPSLDD